MSNSDSSRQEKGEELDRRTRYLLVLVFLVLSAGIVLGGAYYFQEYARSYRAEVEGKLSAVAELKVADLMQWRVERLGDAAVFLENSAFSGTVRRFLENREDPEARQALQAWITKLQGCYQYDRVRLLDPQGATLLSTPDKLPEVPSCVSQQIPEVLRSGEVTLVDFYRSEDDPKIVLTILVPLRDEQNGNRPLGVLSLRIDPEVWLYPFVNRWPTASETAETLIVRRDGNDALFLNQLRFKKDTALNLRIPLIRAGTPAVDAVMGKEGIVYGVDYREVPVVAATRHIPDSPWFLVARMDRSEVEAPLNRRLWQVFVLCCTLLLGAMTSVGLVWRQQRARFYKERYESAQALRTSEEHYRSLFANMINGFAHCRMLFDGQGRPDDLVYLEVNDSFEKLTGLKDVVGRKISEVIPGMREKDPELIQLYGRVALSGVPERTERYVEALGMWLDILVYSVEKGNFIAIFDVITARKEAEEKVRLILADLERSNRDLQQFAYVASHDLQEPLRMVGSYVRLLEQDYGQHLGEEAGQWIRYAAEGADRMKLLLKDLLEYSRAGSESKPGEISDCAGVLEDAVANLRTAIAESGAEVVWDELPVVIADGVQLAQLFQNLIGNAVKFRGTEAPRIRVEALRQDGMWLFSVRDNGLGIEERHAERIFTIFQRLHSREEYPGSGIGLAICRKIVDRHGGRIWVESRPGEGSTFYFTWPAAVDAPPKNSGVRVPETAEPRGSVQ